MGLRLMDPYHQAQISRRPWSSGSLYLQSSYGCGIMVEMDSGRIRYLEDYMELKIPNA